MTTTRQLRFVVPQEKELYPLEVCTGIDAGVWMVGRQLVRASGDIFIPYKEGLTTIQAYDTLQNDSALFEAGFGLAPVTVLLYGIQHDKDFHEMLRRTYQLTGSGVVNSRLLGTPNVTRGEDLQYQGLRNDRPIARIEPQNGYEHVGRLDKTTLWGVRRHSKVEFETPRHLTYMCNADGNRFVELLVKSDGGVEVGASGLPLLGVFTGGARLAKRVD